MYHVFSECFLLAFIDFADDILQSLLECLPAHDSDNDVLLALLTDEVRFPNFVREVPRVTDDAIGRREQQTMALEMPILRNSGQRIGEVLAQAVNFTLECAGVEL